MLVEALTLAFTGALLQAGMGVMTYTEMGDRLDCRRRRDHEGTLTRGHADDHRDPPIAFDPYDYAFQEDPYPVYARLRDEEPLHHNPELDLWALTRHADIAEAFRTEGTYSNSWESRSSSPPGGPMPTR